jgi:hypothetical protein
MSHGPLLDSSAFDLKVPRDLGAREIAAPLACERRRSEIDGYLCCAPRKSQAK